MSFVIDGEIIHSEKELIIFDRGMKSTVMRYECPWTDEEVEKIRQKLKGVTQ